MKKLIGTMKKNLMIIILGILWGLLNLFLVRCTDYNTVCEIGVYSIGFKIPLDFGSPILGGGLPSKILGVNNPIASFFALPTLVGGYVISLFIGALKLVPYSLIESSVVIETILGLSFFLSLFIAPIIGGLLVGYPLLLILQTISKRGLAKPLVLFLIITLAVFYGYVRPSYVVCIPEHGQIGLDLYGKPIAHCCRSLAQKTNPAWNTQDCMKPECELECRYVDTDREGYYDSCDNTYFILIKCG